MYETHKSLSAWQADTDQKSSEAYSFNILKNEYTFVKPVYIADKFEVQIYVRRQSHKFGWNDE